MKPLTKAMLLSPTWIRLKRELEEELAHKREANDHMEPDPFTAFRRGQIAFIKELLDLQQTVDPRADDDGDEA